MLGRTGVFGALLILSGATREPLRADVLAGTPGLLDSAKPFGDGTDVSYQQLYANSLFNALSSSVNITGLQFFIDPSNNFLDPTQPFSSQYTTEYQIFLSAVNPGLDLASSISNDVNSPASPPGQLLFDGELSFTTSGLLTATFSNPFLYDPSGNQDLLLDVERVTPVDSSLSFLLFADSQFSSAVVDPFTCSGGCVYDGQHADPADPTGSTLLPQLGLVTDFIEQPVPTSSIPEPSPMAPAAGLLLVLAITVRHKRRAL